MAKHHRIRKFFGVLIGVLITLLIILLCDVLFWLGPTVKMVAQHVGSKALGAPLTIKELQINPRHGTVHMTGFSIANPAGFGRTNAATLARLDIAVDMASIFSPTVLVHKVEIDHPYFTYEQNTTSDNITRFVKNIEKFSGPQKEEPHKKEAKEEDSEPRIVVVEHLEINKAQFDLAHTDETNLDIKAGFKQLAVSMTNGTVQLKNLYVSNPRKLRTPDLFSLDEISVQIDPVSIYSGPLSIRDIQITHPYAYLERNRQTDSVAEFMKIADRFSKKGDARPATKPPETEVVSADTDTKNTTTNLPPIKLLHLAMDDIQLKLLDTTQTNAPTNPRRLAGIGALSAQLQDGKIRIKGISVANPPGYAATNLFHLADIDVSLDPKSLFSGQTIIQKILVNSPEINLEQTETSGNIASLRETLMGFAPPAPANAGAPTPVDSPVEGEPSKPIPLGQQPVVLQDLVITNFAVSLTLPPKTNAPVQWALSKADIQKLNPMALLNLFGTDTNATEKPEGSEETGSLRLVAFKQLSIRPLKGEMQLNHLRIANPQGFSHRNLAELKQFKLELDPTTLQSDTLLITNILVDAPNIAYERHLTADNIKALQKEIEQVISQGKPQEGQKGKPEKQADTGRKTIIKHLQIKDGTIHPKLSVMPAPSIPFSLELYDIGEKNGGTSIRSLLTNLSGNIYDFIIGKVAETTKLAGNTLKGAGSLSLDALSLITGGATDKLGESLKNKQPEASGEKKKENVESKPRKQRRHTIPHPGRIF